MEATPTIQTANRSRLIVKVVLAVVVIAGVVVLARFIPLRQIFLDALAWISGLGPIGPLVYILLYIVACVLMVPGSILTLGAGFLFGVIEGSVVVSVGSTLGATCAFLVGRYLARDWVGAKIAKIAGNDKFKAIDEAVAAEGWKIVGLTRLSPVFPFIFLNYAFGLTQVKLHHYVIASWLGMLPGTVMYVYIGSLAGDLATLGAGERTRTTGELILLGIGLAATIVVTVFVTRIAKKALDNRIAS